MVNTQVFHWAGVLPGGPFNNTFRLADSGIYAVQVATARGTMGRKLVAP